MTSDQDRYAPRSICFGCGPANDKGLRIKSRWEGDPLAGGRFVMEYTPEPHHQAFPGVVNGGILGTLLDCHSNWCALTTLLHRRKAATGSEEVPCTVTADFHVRLKRPTPAGKPLRLEAWPTDVQDDRATIRCEVQCDGKVTATCDGTFVAVGEGHPAFHRWG
ncbi:MAG TPA: PaaI family thioesterase [Candidatus Thermoplasmatota archaeon]|nr:PaaI family thioesterase [Candidatus Thermoplasmatota archaeon]